jgi:hypothetical protein
MARDNASLELEDMELHTGEEESKAKSDLKSNNKVGSGEEGEEDNTSIGMAIASMKKDLFKVDRTSTPGGNKFMGKQANRESGSRFPGWWPPRPLRRMASPVERKEPSLQKERSSLSEYRQQRRPQARTQR